MSSFTPSGLVYPFLPVDQEFYHDEYYDSNGSYIVPPSELYIADTAMHPGSYYGQPYLEWEKAFTEKEFQASAPKSIADWFRRLSTPEGTQPESPRYSPAPPPEIEYINADLAKAYGMDASTAYQEALANTSYQRAVKDLQAAGLNPVLAASGLDGASGVYSVRKNGSGFSVGANVSSAHDSYKMLSNLGTLVGALAGFKVGGIKGAVAGAAVGSQTGASLGNLMDAR